MVAKPPNIERKLFAPLDGGTVIVDKDMRATVLDQYKLYVEMADRISARRQVANTFAMSVNTALVVVVGYLQTEHAALKGGLFIAVAVAGIFLNFIWSRMIASYRDLNTAKFKVIHDIETRLPISPYDAEWEAVGRGEDNTRYFPFTHIEVFVPWVFFALHVVVLALLTPWSTLTPVR